MAEFTDDAAPVKWRVVRSTKSPRPPSLPRDVPQDLSPPRVVTRRRRHDSSDESPTQKRFNRMTHGSPDASPPRGNERTRHDSPDVSPPRRGRNTGHGSPVQQRRARHDSPESDLSPPRIQPQDQDLSPPRRIGSQDLSPPRRHRNRSSDLSPLRKGKTANQAYPDLSPPRRGTGDKREHYGHGNNHSSFREGNHRVSCRPIKLYCL